MGKRFGEPWAIYAKRSTKLIQNGPKNTHTNKKGIERTTIMHSASYIAMVGHNSREKTSNCSWTTENSRKAETSAFYID